VQFLKLTCGTEDSFARGLEAGVAKIMEVSRELVVWAHIQSHENRNSPSLMLTSWQMFLRSGLVDPRDTPLKHIDGIHWCCSTHHELWERLGREACNISRCNLSASRAHFCRGLPYLGRCSKMVSYVCSESGWLLVSMGDPGCCVFQSHQCGNDSEQLKLTMALPFWPFVCRSWRKVNGSAFFRPGRIIRCCVGFARRAVGFVARRGCPIR
jgi:hypothetical protein